MTIADDLTRGLCALVGTDPDERLKAAATLELALKQELEAGRTDWEEWVQACLPVLVRAIGDRHKGVQVHAANCLQFLSYQSAAVLPALREAMAGPDPWQAWGAAIVVARLSIWLPELAAALTGAMGATDRDVRWAAAGYSLALGRKYPEAVAMVTAALHHPNPITRKMAAYCLGAMGAYADVEATLAGQLDDPDRAVRRAVILALDKLPRLSEPVRSHIAALRSDPDEFVRRTATAVAAKWGA